MDHMFKSILVVDDEKNAREGLKRYLENESYDVTLAEDGAKALELFKTNHFDLALIDLKMPGMDGMTLLHKVKNLKKDCIIIILTAYGTVETAVQAMKAGAFHYLTKPINLDELQIALKKAFREQALEHENQNLRSDLMREKYESGKIIGKSPKIREMLQIAEQVAKSNATVLIQGESGTGKELLAHAIHNLSPRKDRPFVTVHCAALTESLLTSELFGHERGAFTGATERKIGRFELANSGTLFLDEIGEISEQTQIKLLRFLQNGEFERVGSAKPLHSDVRLICATNKNLQEAVKAGKFREDLFYRINVILLKSPPLRERTSDIPMLAEHFLKHFSQINGKAITGISSQAMKQLQTYEWPGNIRELRNVIERMVVLSKGGNIELENLPEDIQVPNTKVGIDNLSTQSSDSSLSHVEKSVISKTLEALKGNKSLAAKKLGISRRTLYRKLDEYQITV